VGSFAKPLTEEQAEVARFKRDVAELKMERDFLTKAAAYFVKGSQSGKRP
jgi:transposase